MSQFAEFLPLIAFFAAYKMYDIYTAIVVMVIVMGVTMAYGKFKGKNPSKMQLGSLVLLIVFGGATVYLKDEMFLKWKPTILNWGFGIAFLGSHFIGKKTFAERMMESANIIATKGVWSRINISWILFFVVVGTLNLFVAYNFSTDFWINFKVFGSLGLTLVFVLGQVFYLMKVAKMPEQVKVDKSEESK